jgi:hypothetical protein
VQKPGQILYVPEGWYHAVRNEVPSLAVAYQLQTGELRGDNSLAHPDLERYNALARALRHQKPEPSTVEKADKELMGWLSGFDGMQDVDESTCTEALLLAGEWKMDVMNKHVGGQSLEAGGGKGEEGNTNEAAVFFFDRVLAIDPFHANTWMRKALALEAEAAAEAEAEAAEHEAGDLSERKHSDTGTTTGSRADYLYHSQQAYERAFSINPRSLEIVKALVKFYETHTRTTAGLTHAARIVNQTLAMPKCQRLGNDRPSADMDSKSMLFWVTQVESLHDTLYSLNADLRLLRENNCTRFSKGPAVWGQPICV